ncbi:MAG: hypothetical protein ABL878_05895 [Burkholderiales bacterium]
MNLDLVALRIPGLVLVIALMVAIGLVRYSTGSLESAAKRNQAQMAQTQKARDQLHQSDQERNTILQYLPAYRQLEQIGFVGDEQRLNWVENLRMANQKSGLFGVQYEIAARAPFSRAGANNPIASQIRHSRMKIAFGIVHEGDLMRFLKTLFEQGGGLYTLTDCSLQRGPTADAPEARRPNLLAQCSLEWLTVQPKPAAQ